MSAGRIAQILGAVLIVCVTCMILKAVNSEAAADYADYIVTKIQSIGRRGALKGKAAKAKINNSADSEMLKKIIEENSDDFTR